MIGTPCCRSAVNHYFSRMKLVSFLKNYNPRVLHNPYVIAEAGVNHEGSMELAKRLIDEAAEGGAHAIKFQTYKAARKPAELTCDPRWSNR